MQTRTFGGATTVTSERMSLALAPALTPTGLNADPSFFHGFAAYPSALAHGLVTLADVTATRYHHYVPSDERDPVLTAHGDRLRAECFSACNSVYARLDLLSDGLDGGEIGYGTTNVDISARTRQALVAVSRDELLHLDVGLEGLRVGTPDRQSTERPVRMPDRWVRALGNVAELHHQLRPMFTLGRAATRAFLASVPSVTTNTRHDGWLTPGRAGARLERRRTRDAVQLVGLHRLSALKRLMTHAEGLTAYAAEDGHGKDPAVSLFELTLPGARLSLGLTSTTFRGFSGEGALLPALAAVGVLDDADLVSVLLAFEPVLDADRLARESGLPIERVERALSVLATSGRVGWDPHDSAWFHRELPHDPNRVERDNPRLRAARELVRNRAVSRGADGAVRVHSGDAAYRVTLDADAGDRCSCAWYAKHTGGRGPCKHVLAVRLHLDSGPREGASPDSTAFDR